MRRGAESIDRPSPPAATRRIRVGFISPGMGIGGAERWVLALCKSFSRAIEVVAIFTEDREGPLVGEARRQAPLLPFSAIAHTPCDILIAWGCPQLSQIVPFMLWPRTVAVSHGSPDLEWSAESCTKMARGARHLVAVSESAARSWPRRRQNEVTILPNGAEVERCVPRCGREAKRAALGIGVHDNVALFLGRLAPEKRPWLMGQMLEHLPENWRSIVCGPITTPWWGLEERRPEVWGLHPRVIMHDPVDHPGDLLAAADVFVLPSVTEGFPLALAEAWLAGLPTVCCDWPIIKRLNAEHGFLSTAVRVNSTAPEFAEAVESATLLQATARKASRIAWQHYTAPAMAERWENYLTGIAA